MEQLIIIEQTKPIIITNYQKVKDELELICSNYKGLEVTEDNLKDVKVTQANMARLRIELEDKRKDVKKELLKPIDVFENEMKSLVTLITNVENPIKAGIQVFTDKVRNDKRIAIQNEIDKITTDIGLDESYTKRIVIDERWLNITASPKQVKEEMELAIKTMINEQNRDGERAELIINQIDLVNEKYQLKSLLLFDNFMYLIKTDMTIVEIIHIIDDKAKERKAQQDEIENKLKAELQPPLVMDCTAPFTPYEDDRHSVVTENTRMLKFVCTDEQFNTIKNYFKIINIEIM